MFDWRGFLRKHRIEFEEAGRHHTVGNIGIHCPFCGASDPSFHLGISVEGKGWRCWRNRQHAGKSDAKLVSALLNCSFDEALAIVGHVRAMPNNFMQEVTDLLKPTIKPQAVNKLTMPKEFKPFTGTSRAERPFINYLLSRSKGFNKSEVYDFAERFDLRWVLNGPYRYRIIFPIYENGKLVTWTGRSIGDSSLRYKTLSHKIEKAQEEGFDPAAGPVSDYLLWQDDLQNERRASTLVLCEGPFDAWRVRTLGESHGVIGTCFFTASASRAQVEHLHEILPRYSRRIILLDAETLATAMELQARLAALSVTFRSLPSDVKDPGEIPDATALLRYIK